MNPPSVLVAITAAGASERMGRTKALLSWHGVTFLEGMVRSARGAGLSEICVVVGADSDTVSLEVERLGVRVLPNPRHAEGRTTSLKLAAELAAGRGAWLMLWPVDCPAVSSGALASLMAAARERPDANFAPAFEGRHGHPVLLSPVTIDRLRAASEEENLRDLLRGGPVERVTVPVDDPAVLDNVNTKTDYRAFLEQRPRPTPEQEVHDD